MSRDFFCSDSFVHLSGRALEAIQGQMVKIVMKIVQMFPYPIEAVRYGLEIADVGTADPASFCIDFR